MFVDQALLHVRSGKGGDGVVHFRREKYVPRGGPDGGDGGKGGNVLLEATTSMNTLVAFRHQPRFQGEDGKNGARQNMTGRSGEDRVILVPIGTIIYDQATGQVLGDLVEPGQHLLIAKGGRGGRGNARFASSVNQAPRIAEKGEPPQERSLRLELKLIADVGIVGVPNAGKSTLLSVVSNARPKIAAYPFTTIEPQLGVAMLDEDASLVLADIPGLIEGAHLGVGLGHEFLRHIQRTRVLIHLVDGLSADPLLDYAQINSELSLFDPSLGQKPQVVAINKIDLPDVQQRLPELIASFKHRNLEVMTVSAAAGTNVRELLFKAYHTLQNAPPMVEVEEMPVYRAASDPNAFSISETPDGWRISGESIERAASMTYWEEFQSIRRFQRILETLKIDAALRKAGIENGDTVHIGDFELEWQD